MLKNTILGLCALLFSVQSFGYSNEKGTYEYNCSGNCGHGTYPVPGNPPYCQSCPPGYFCQYNEMSICYVPCACAGGNTGHPPSWQMEPYCSGRTSEVICTLSSSGSRVCNIPAYRYQFYTIHSGSFVVAYGPAYYGDSCTLYFNVQFLENYRYGASCGYIWTGTENDRGIVKVIGYM